MTCEEIQPRLSEYLENLLDPEMASSVKGHLSSCPLCTGEAEALKESIRIVASLPPVEPPAGFSRNVMATIRKEAGKLSFRQRLFLPLRIKVPIHATAMILIGGLAVYLYQTSRPYEGEMARSRPANLERSAREDSHLKETEKDVRPLAAPLPVLSDRKNKAADPMALGGLETSDESGPGKMRSLGFRARRERAESEATAQTDLVLVPGKLEAGGKTLEQELDNLVQRVNGNYIQPREADKASEEGRRLKTRTFWLRIPADQYGRFRSELASMGRIAPEPGLRPSKAQASVDSLESLTIRLVILPPER